MTQEDHNALTVHVQLILDAGPATLSEGEAWKYMQRTLSDFLAGRVGVEALTTALGVSELWRLNHQREQVTVLRRIARRLRRQQARFSIFADAARAAKGTR